MKVRFNFHKILVLTLFLVLCVHITKASIQELFKWPEEMTVFLPENAKDEKNGVDSHNENLLLISFGILNVSLSTKKLTRI